MPRRRTAPAPPKPRPRAVRQPASPGVPVRAATPRHDGITPERQRVFFETLAATGSVSQAATACGLSRQALYAYRNRADVPAFREAWDVAMSCAINILGDIAFARAVDGVEESVFWKGQLVGTRQRYNYNLLLTLLRVRDPLGFAPQSDIRHLARGRMYVTRPRLDGALDALEREAAGTLDFAYDDDPGGVLDR